MDRRSNTRHSMTRQPLSDTTRKANNYATTGNVGLTRHSIDEKALLKAAALRAKLQSENAQPGYRSECCATHGATANRYSADFQAKSLATTPDPLEQERRPSGISQQHYEGDTKPKQSEARRVSQFSDISSTASSTRQLKTHIGPWQLGKTLRKGSSARVRIARHRATHQLSAVKIVSKSTAHLNQAGSLNHIDKVDSKMPVSKDGSRRMPLAIEREVAILRLIEHPNVIKLHDIWENRSEIYLVTEFVERGDLFTFINSQPAGLDEEHVMYFFRQIMSALDYCHSLNICHRDLKPENILLTNDFTIKVADFGMAALHQAPKHQLKTACGSPHYAAPELLKHRAYRGSAADIWSMGVILFAMLAGRLPFDDSDLHVMLSKARNAQYEMPQVFGDAIQDLIRRILVPNPGNRITMDQMWRHEVIDYYSYLDKHMKEPCRVRNRRPEADATPVPEKEIDNQILRQLRSMWHSYSDNDIKAMLTSPKPNDQKVFYRLLYNHREMQLENYNNEVLISKTDYHHLKPANWRKRASTCQFTQPARKGHARNVSRFTVITNVAEADESATVRSYDPYNASRILHPWNSQASHAKITVHRTGTEGAMSHSYRSYRSIGGSFQQRKRFNSQRSHAMGSTRSRSSMSSIQSSRGGTPRVRASTRYRRGVDFSSIRRPSAHEARRNVGRGSIAGDGFNRGRNGQGRPPSRRGSSPRKTGNIKVAAQPLKPRDHTYLWNEELKQLGASVAKTCDEAFRSSLLLPDAAEENSEGPSYADLLTSLPSTLDATGTQLSTSVSAGKQTLPRPSWDLRPLPPPPPEDASTPKHHKFGPFGGNAMADGQKASNNWVVSSISKMGVSDRRTVSAPLRNQSQQRKDTRSALPSIYESSPNPRTGNPSKPRIVSAPADPPAQTNPRSTKGLDFLTKTDRTIRVVNSPSLARNASAIADNMTPAPLSIRKKPSGALTEGPAIKANRIMEKSESDWQTTTMGTRSATPSLESETAAAAVLTKKKTSWFKRSSKDESQNINILAAMTDTMTSRAKDPRISVFAEVQKPQRTASRSATGSNIGRPPPPPQAKKKSFSLSFWKGQKDTKSEYRMSLAGAEDDEVPSPEPERTRPMRPRRVFSGTSAVCGVGCTWNDQDAGIRQIEVHQNWLARLFRVKPATRNLCFAITKRRARQEIALLLREWRRHGIKDVEVDKERNIVFAKVGAKNYLNIKEVSFAAEVMTVIEHGKRNLLSIVRVTQERGAASSFQKVVDVMKSVFAARNLLVADKQKRKMMIKTLNS